MNKLKEAVAALKQHLGRDERGLSLLSQVERIANDQRKSLAEAREETAPVRAALQASRDEANARKDRMTQQESELLRLQSVANQRQRDIESLTKELAEARRQLAELDSIAEPSYDGLQDVSLDSAAKRLFSPPTDRAFVDDLPSVVAAFGALRREVRVCPKPTLRRDKTACGLHYELEDVINNLSVAEFAKLGRMVACMALYNFPIVVIARKVVVDQIADDFEAKERILAPFVQWARKGFKKGDPVEISMLPRR